MGRTLRIDDGIEQQLGRAARTPAAADEVVVDVNRLSALVAEGGVEDVAVGGRPARLAVHDVVGGAALADAAALGRAVVVGRAVVGRGARVGHAEAHGLRRFEKKI